MVAMASPAVASVPISLPTVPYSFQLQDYGRCTLPKTAITITGATKYRPKLLVEFQATHGSSAVNAEVINLCRDWRLKDALGALRIMEERRISVDCDTYIFLLQVCANTKVLEVGQQLHAHMLVSGIEVNALLGVKIVDMYVRCGCLASARQVFDKMPERNLFMWNAMIRVEVRQGRYERALVLFREMQIEGVTTSPSIITSVLPACANLGEGRMVHACTIKSGFESNVFVGNCLTGVYAKCGTIEDARRVFDKMCDRNVVSWNVMISGCARKGYVDEALKLFHQMKLGGVMPDVISWTAVIAGFSQNGCGFEALELFRQMQLAGEKSNSITIASVLPACADLAALEYGKEIHDHIIRTGCVSSVIAGNALIDMYAKCGRPEDARRVFDKMSLRDVISWNAMIAGYVKNGQCEEAEKLFHEMQLAGIKPNTVTWNAMIAGLSQTGQGHKALEYFNQMHLAGVKPDIVTWTAKIAGDVQNGHVDEALKLFSQMKLLGIKPDMVLWTAIIAGYVQNGHGDQGLKLFCEMQLEGFKPDCVSISSILPACARLAILRQGKEVHSYIVRNGFDSDVSVGNALIDMYARCGCIDAARQVFDKMFQLDVVSWNAMIVGYAMHGLAEDALALFYEMQQGGMQPDNITFTGVLSACCHAGLVDEGQKYFDCMGRDYHITPNLQHYACMVDLIGRTGRLDEAHNFINKMPLEPDACMLGSLLGACRVHCNIELGELVARRLFALEPENAGNYVLLSNIYAAAGKWDDVAKVRKLMNDKGVKKRPGCSWIEVKNKVHVFHAGDKSHPKMEQIYATLESLAGHMEEAGYAPDTDFVLYDVKEEEKEHILCGHSEKLAIAFGLISSCPGTPIRIMKNLRVCGDCHSVMKFISKTAGREIIVRDASRFHHFKGGMCSCQNYW